MKKTHEILDNNFILKHERYINLAFEGQLCHKPFRFLSAWYFSYHFQDYKVNTFNLTKYSTYDPCHGFNVYE